MPNEPADAENPVTTNRTKIGLRADMTIDDEPVAIEGILDGNFFLQLSQPATLGTPISFAYWLRDKYKVENLDLMLPTETYKTAAEFKSAYKSYQAETNKDKRAKFEKAIGDHLEGKVPAQLVNLVRTAFLAELKITDLMIDIKTKEGGNDVASQKLMFGLSVGFPAPLDLIPNVEVNKLSILIMNAPENDFKFPPRVALPQATPLPVPPSKATGQITFAGQPAADSTIALGADIWTFVAEAKKDREVSLGSNLEATLTELASQLNKQGKGDTALCSYRADPEAQRLEITYRDEGFAGNIFQIAADEKSQGKLSGPTLSGGFSGDKPADKIVDDTPKKASGTIVFSAQPADNSKIVLNGTDWAFSADAPAAGTNGSQIGADVAKTVENLVAALTKSKDAQISKCDYAAEENTLRITSKTAGKDGNSFKVVATKESKGTASGPSLTGG